jgi:hypothetical protein
MPYGACHWADTVHACGKYLSRPDPWTGKTSEAAHNAQGRFFKFLATWPDGRQCYLCQMPRQTIDEMREQFPDVTHIEPVTGEHYDDE